MPITALPTLDRTSPTFKADTDLFFGTKLPAFSVEAEAARVTIVAAESSAATSATTATTQAATATTQASLATTNGAAQVALATTQANLATTNGAAQVTLAAAQVALAQSVANYKGLWSALTGALAMPASVSHQGQFWALNNALADVTLAVPGVSAAWTAIGGGGELADALFYSMF